MASFRLCLILSFTTLSDAESSLDYPFITLSYVLFVVAFSYIAFILFITNDFIAPRISYRYFFWASLTMIVFLYFARRVSCSGVRGIDGSISGGSWTGLCLSYIITSSRSSPTLVFLLFVFLLLFFVTVDFLLLGLPLLRLLTVPPGDKYFVDDLLKLLSSWD